MNEREAEDFLSWNGWPVTTRAERRAERFTLFGGCSQCFRGDYWEPPAMCGECEDDAYEAEREAAEAAFVDELEYERDLAFEALVQAPTEANT